MEKAMVTGIGCVSALGEGVSRFWDGLLGGETGIAPINGFSREYLRNPTAGEVTLSSRMQAYAESRSIGSRISLFADLAISEALAGSGLSEKDLQGKRSGLVLGVSLGMSLVRPDADAPANGLESPGGALDDLSGLAGELAGRFGIGGEAMTVSTACAAGTNAVGIAREMIAWEGYDIVICGGSDTLDRMKYLGHSALNTLTQTDIRPFAPDRGGTIFGEGAGILILEAERNLRGRPALGVCSGAGFSCDAYQITAPDPGASGAVHAMREALRDAGLSPSDIDYINLHGSGTHHNDSMESLAICEVFGDGAERIPASSIKSAIGHTMGAAGGCESVATVLSVLHQQVPPTANVAEKDPQFPLRLVCSRPLSWKIGHALSNSFGFGGCNGTVVFSRWTP